jgi:NTE family protein
MKFGLALGGGGARGAAHIGVLIELEKLGLKPDIVTGTSIGGLVGALIATGLDSSQVIEVFRRMRFGKLYSPPWLKPALMNNNKLEKLLEKSIGRPSFAGLKIPLAVVTTNLVTREEVILEEGDVVKAVLATTAFPVVLPQVDWHGQILIDGGVLNNTPFNIAQERGADFVLAVDLANSAPFGTEIPFPTPNNFLTRLLTRAQREPLYQAVSTLADILTSQNVDNHLEESQPDIMLRPNMATIGLFDFHRLDEGIAFGREAAQAVEPQLRELAARMNDAST